MALFPVLAIVLPLSGAAGVLILSLVPRWRSYTRYVVLAVLGLATLVLIAVRGAGAVVLVPSLWRPSLLFGVPLMLQSDTSVQPFAFVTMLAACCAILATIGGAAPLQARLVIASLALLAAQLGSLWAANPLTMIVAWAIYDLLLAAALIAAGGSSRVAIRGLIFGSLATLLLWGGTFRAGSEGGSDLWSLMAPSAAQLSLWAAAGILRVWVYPFHLAMPDELGTTEPPYMPFLAPLLFGPVNGWGLWLRLAQANDGELPGSTWVPGLAAVTLVLGGFLAWSCRNPRRSVPWAGMGASGSLLLAAQLAGRDAAAIITAGGIAWVLSVTALFLYDGLRREALWGSVPALIGALALLGVPLTLGFAPQAVLLGRLYRQALFGMGAAFFLGNLFLIPALARVLLAPCSDPLPPKRLLMLMAVGWGLPVLLLVATGLYPPLLIGDAAYRVLLLRGLIKQPGLAGWLLWALSLAGGGVLVWQDRNVRPRIAFLLSAIHDFLGLEWLYSLLAGALKRGLSVLQATDEVVGGAGALLWSFLLFLLFLIVGGVR